MRPILTLLAVSFIAYAADQHLFAGRYSSAMEQIAIQILHHSGFR